MSMVSCWYCIYPDPECCKPTAVESRPSKELNVSHRPQSASSSTSKIWKDNSIESPVLTLRAIHNQLVLGSCYHQTEHVSTDLWVLIPLSVCHHLCPRNKNEISELSEL